jgi:hypothetical protein
MGLGPYSGIVEVHLGETLPFLWDGFLRLIGKDKESAELKEWFTNLQRIGFIEASSVQCIGMHGPLPLEQIFQPTKLAWGVPNLTYRAEDGKSVTLVLPCLPVTPDSFFAVPTDAAIFAGPGWGKTTFLHHIMVKYCKSNKYIPILITLRRPSAIDDLSRLVDMLTPLKKLQHGIQILLLVDGYDEVPTSSRKLVSEKLLKFQAKEIGRFYLTCRDFYQVFDLSIPSVRIAPFDEDDQERFVGSFATAFGSKIKPKEMLQELRDRGMDDLLHHPLLLSMVCIVKSGSMSLHSKSVLALIERALETLSFRWDEGKGIVREEKLPVDGKARVQCLMRIAFHSKKPQVDVRTVMEQTRAQLDLLRWEGLDERQFIEETARFFGILIPKDEESWEFVHKTLYDYLAARYWVEKGQFAPWMVANWDSRAAYAACLSYDATEAMKITFAKPEWFPAFTEMLSNDAPFDHLKIATDFIEHYNIYPRDLHYNQLSSLTASVSMARDCVHVSSSKFLQELASECCRHNSIGAVVVFAYAIAELRDRGQRLSQTDYLRARERFSENFTFTVDRGGNSVQISIKNMIPK